MSALASSSWVHFACHAHSDPTSPSNSHLLLHDGPMSVAEVSRLRLKYAELADEAIHIASAFQLAGYRHVVGALWPLDDTTAAGVTESFYRHLTDGKSPADALHVVIRSMRDEQPTDTLPVGRLRPRWPLIRMVAGGCCPLAGPRREKLAT